MAFVTGKDLVTKEICDALGLRHVRKLDLHIDVHSAVTVEAEFYPEIDGVIQFVPILKKFKLVDFNEGEEKE